MEPTNLKLDDRAPQPVACLHQPAPAELVGQIGEAIREVSAYLTAHDVEVAGPPYARSTWQAGSDLEIGFPVKRAIAGDGRVVAGELPGGTVAVALHAGPHDRIPETTTALRSWLADQGMSEAGVPWETYLTNPREHPDPADWRNEIVIPVVPARARG